MIIILLYSRHQKYMKKSPFNSKYITFSLVFIVASFAFVQSVHADTYSHMCGYGGGRINSTVNLTTSSFIANLTPNPLPNATFQINSTCQTRDVSLTVKNASNRTQVLFSGTVFSGANLTFSTSFTPPSLAGSYAVYFATAVDEAESQQEIFEVHPLCTSPSLLYASPFPGIYTGIYLYYDIGQTNPYLGGYVSDENGNVYIMNGNIVGNATGDTC